MVEEKTGKSAEGGTTVETPKHQQQQQQQQEEARDAFLDQTRQLLSLDGRPFEIAAESLKSQEQQLERQEAHLLKQEQQHAVQEAILDAQLRQVSAAKGTAKELEPQGTPQMRAAKAGGASLENLASGVEDVLRNLADMQQQMENKEAETHEAKGLDVGGEAEGGRDRTELTPEEAAGVLRLEQLRQLKQLKHEEAHLKMRVLQQQQLKMQELQLQRLQMEMQELELKQLLRLQEARKQGSEPVPTEPTQSPTEH